MSRLLILVLLFCTSHIACAVDATDNVTVIDKVGNWKFVEFAGATQIMYRIASDSVNSEGRHIAFDFLESNDCIPTPAVIIADMDSYNEILNDGQLPIVYKLPNQEQAMEVTETVMTEGDRFAFFSFEKLTAQILLQSEDKGKLAIWIPASSDGRVKRSDNIYFSLEGFSSAYIKAERTCSENQ